MLKSLREAVNSPQGEFSSTFDKIIIEANFGDGMFSKLLQPKLMARYPVGVEEVKHSTQKERRICDTLEPVIQSHGSW